MKNIKIIILLVLGAALIQACEPKDDMLNYNGPAVGHFAEGDGELVAASDQDATSDPATVRLLIDPASTAIEGVHFQSFTQTVEIAAGQYISEIEIKPITANLETAQLLVLSIDSPDFPEGVSFNQKFELSLSRLCPVNDLSTIIGSRGGIDVTIDGLGWPPYPSEVVISGTSGDLRVTGLGVGWMTDFWGEVIITMEEVEMEVTEGLYVTIPEQPYMTTTYEGAPQDPYTIVGSGTLDNCAKTLTIEYDLKQGDNSWGSWTSSNGYMSESTFTAVLTIP